MGVYPLLQNETCCFLALDFDKQSWQADAGAFMETCAAENVPAALERSRSGNGAHVWIFFERLVPAVKARQLIGSAGTRSKKECWQYEKECRGICKNASCL
jgi:hypothetical protein